MSMQKLKGRARSPSQNESAGTSGLWKYDPENIEQVQRAIEIILELGDPQLLQTNPSFIDYVEGTIRLAPYCSDEMKELVEGVLAPTWYETLANPGKSSASYSVAVSHFTGLPLSLCGPHNGTTQATTTGWYVKPADQILPASERPLTPPPTIESSSPSSVPAELGWDDETSSADGTSAVDNTIAAWTQGQHDPGSPDETAAPHVEGSKTLNVITGSTPSSAPPASIRGPSKRNQYKGNAQASTASTSTCKPTTRHISDDLQTSFDRLTVGNHASSSSTSAAVLDESDIPDSAWALHSEAHLRLLAASRFLDTFPQQSLVLQDEPMVARVARAEAMEALYRGGQDNITAAEQFLKALGKQEEWEKENGYGGR